MTSSTVAGAFGEEICGDVGGQSWQHWSGSWSGNDRHWPWSSEDSHGGFAMSFLWPRAKGLDSYAGWAKETCLISSKCRLLQQLVKRDRHAESMNCLSYFDVYVWMRWDAHQKHLFLSAYYKSGSNRWTLHTNHQLMRRKRWWEPALPLRWRRQFEQWPALVPTSFHQPKEKPTSLCRSFDVPLCWNCNYELGRPSATVCWGHAGWTAFPLHDDGCSTRLGIGENEVWRCSSQEHFYPGLYPAALNHLAVGVWME